LSAGAAAFGAVALVCCDLRHATYFRDAGGGVLSDGLFCRHAQRPGMGFRGPLQILQYRFCADTIRRSIGAEAGNASWNASTSIALGG